MRCPLLLCSVCAVPLAEELQGPKLPGPPHRRQGAHQPPHHGEQGLVEKDGVSERMRMRIMARSALRRREAGGEGRVEEKLRAPHGRGKGQRGKRVKGQEGFASKGSGQGGKG